MSRPRIHWRERASLALKAARKRPDECWPWAGSLNTHGYGHFSWFGYDEELPRRKHENAHRVIWQLANGPAKPDSHIDHLCSNRACVNPAHLEEVTATENKRRGAGFAGKNARKTHCPRGHRLAGANVYQDKRGTRSCLKCRRSMANAYHKANPAKHREAQRRYLARKRAA